MTENEFWIRLWSIMGGVIVMISLLLGMGGMHSTAVMGKMVESGVDPIAAHCAVYGSYGRSMCDLLVAKRVN
jgi:hypothetical protein